MPPSKAWKQGERKAARAFSTQRNPLSGRNSKHSASDSLHKRLFLECKQRKVSTIHTLFEKTLRLAQKERKLPVLVLRKNNSPRVLIVCELEHLAEIAAEHIG